MTYGAAVPRIHPRPTLDNLRGPLIPVGDRPSPSRTVVPVQTSNYTTTDTNAPSTSQIDLNSTSQYPSREPSVNNIDTVTNDQSYVDEYDRTIDTTQDRYMRDRSPSIYQEPQTSPEYPFSRPVSPITPKSPTAKIKQKPKLTLALSRLGRQGPDLSESNRIREDLKLHVANPTFTHENLRQRNYDAFFESGEPVYSIERKLHITTPEPDSSSPLSNLQEFSSSGYESSIHSASPKSRRFLFSGSKTPNNLRSKSTENYSNSLVKRAAEVPQKETSKNSGGRHRSLFGWRGLRSSSLGPQASMAAYTGVLKDYGHASLNEALKTQNGVTFKLVKTVSDFTETLSHLYEEHAAALQTLVSTYRKKNGDLRKERPACHSTLFYAWETFLQEIEADSQASSDVASALSRQVSRPMLDKSFHRKVQSRKIFTHRESFETIITKTEEKLAKCRLDYKQCYLAHRQNPTQHSLSQYIDAHNAYVQQLHATNAMLEAYHCDTIPQLMQELEEIYSDLCSIVTEAVIQGAEVISSKAADQIKRYDGLSNQCKTISPQQDLTNFVRILPQSPNPQKVPKRAFAPPQPPAEGEEPSDFNDNSPPPFRNELVIERNSSVQLRTSLEALKREAADLEMQIRQLQDTVDAMVRTQIRGIENQLYNKANELQEDLSMKKFDLRAKQIHLAAVRAQKELFLTKLDPGSPRGERKLSSASSSSMKTKWLKAFRSLKPASGSSSAQPERRNGATGAQSVRPNEDGSHNLQEYTYKKITPCDVCSQILRGHTRQGLRCRICKLNVHADCAPQLPKCQAKQKLLRRQKSTSELENRVDVEEENDGSERTRPFGQPLCLLAEGLPDDEQPKKTGRKKR